MKTNSNIYLRKRIIGILPKNISIDEIFHKNMIDSGFNAQMEYSRAGFKTQYAYTLKTNYFEFFSFNKALKVIIDYKQFKKEHINQFMFYVPEYFWIYEDLTVNTINTINTIKRWKVVEDIIKLDNPLKGRTLVNSRKQIEFANAIEKNILLYENNRNIKR
jgi:hypothetical protein